MGVTPADERMLVWRAAGGLNYHDGSPLMKRTCELANNPVWDALGDWGAQNLNPGLLAGAVVGVWTW